MNETVPDRVANFGSEVEEPKLTPETLDSHVDKLPRPTGYRILILPFSMPGVTKSGIHLAKLFLPK